ncbi:MAG TPA: hypothetical protein VEZ90_14765, partial [Blastocatellia bacterium]|nr:hypothetical protein [Blastocatellia bacterium]
LVKTPLPTLILLAGGVIYTARHRDWRQPALLLTPVIVYFAFAMTGPFEIGYRHLLPILPFLFVFIGPLANIQIEPFKWVKWIVPALIVWLIVGAIRIYPDYLAYFNEAAGGPAGGARILADSNVDWGQDLPGLRDYINRENLDSIYLSYFGSAPPTAYGIKTFQPLPSYPYNYPGVESNVGKLSNPPPGVYAISVTSLQGIFFKDRNLYGWFRARTPDAVIGHTIYVYRIK